MGWDGKRVKNEDTFLPGRRSNDIPQSIGLTRGPGKIAVWPNLLEGTKEEIEHAYGG